MKNNLCNKINNNDTDLSYIIKTILQKAFNEEKLQNKDNIIFGITVILIFFNPTYDQAEIVSSKVQKRMNKWDSDPIVRNRLEYKESSENDIMNHDSITEDNNKEFADFNNQSNSLEEGDNQDKKDNSDDSNDIE
ncbi:13442_t:CDS:2 [Funneliformis mosseae]|uniref:13442_t:CDS:1 n=1 Tax=Funneliformis mosseae TaxID=27381 RepID=A0A9N9HX60_FUNMO|nr:13442_t:CDS:2 [Funneliformis mosseae]